jgi:ubiquinone/menaquinone biosynthesis C-methylase UbiE
VPSFQDHFSSVATQYAEFRPRYPAALFDFLTSLMHERELAWDCACGNGQATLDLAARCARVWATDASAEQIAAASAHPRVTYRVAPAEDSGLPERCADLVTVAQALHWLDLDSFYAEVTRVLKPGALLAVWTYTTLRLDPPLDAPIAAFNARIAPYWPANRRHVDAGYRTLAFPFPELEAPPLEMVERWGLDHLLGYARSWSATVRYRAQHREDPGVDLARELEPLWGDRAQPHRVRWPVVLRVGRQR